MNHWDFGQPADRRDAPPLFGGDYGPRGVGSPAGSSAPAGSTALGEATGSASDRGSVAGGWQDTADWQENTDSQEDTEQWAEDGYIDSGDWSAAGDWSDDEPTGEEGAAPYPITYERAEFDATSAEAEPPSAAPFEPWPAAPRPAGLPDDFWPRSNAEAPTRTWERELPPDPANQEGWRPPRGQRHGSVTLPGMGGRRVLVPVGIALLAAVLGGGTVLLTNRSAANTSMARGLATPTASASAAMSTAMSAPSSAGSASGTATASAASGTAPLTMTQAQAILAAYTQGNNSANANRSDTMLAAVETGSSFAIDAGLYQQQRGTNAGPFPAFAPVHATYYLPRNEPASAPHWFVVQVANAFAATPHKVSSTEYLLFTQAAPGGPWLNAVEPYILASATAPQVTLGADGLATSVDPATTAFVAAPNQLPQLTAAAENGTGTGTGITVPASVSDLNDTRFWRGKLHHATVTDAHAVATGTAAQVHALQTAGGGALVFYNDAAQLTITANSGHKLHLTVPGFLSSAQTLTSASISYLEQFAAYDPAPGGTTGTPTIVAQYSGITAAN